MTQHFDVVIVGGAVTGSILALALSSVSEHKMNIAVVEKFTPDYSTQGGFDARSIALAYGSLQKLAQIYPLGGGNLAELVYSFATPIQQIWVSDKGHFGKTCLSAQEMKLPELGVVVELARLGEKLNALLAQQPNIRLFCPDSVSQLHRTAEKAHLTLASGHALSAQLIIAADGIQSQIAQGCGIETLTLKDYGQSAIIANVKISEPHQHQAFERFTAQGPFALLPLGEKMMSLVWCVADPTTLMAANDDDFLRAMQQQFGWKLGKFQQVSKRFVYPLHSQKAERHTAHRLAIVGNAAQLLHPVAGQGFNLGMRDLFTLSQLLGQAFQKGEDLGNHPLLCRFEQARLADQEKMIASTSGLISLFSCQQLPVQILRNLGLIALSHSRLARRWVANQALGF
ncbi:2-octaprenyl-6-methoxyphenyl hydroxylase [Pasteurellaceae bacterium Macca]|nr:2-octaprenyl-6-methoxyphenyl hydroxylase [Pasteurellaceae bacterium Macca]